MGIKLFLPASLVGGLLVYGWQVAQPGDLPFFYAVVSFLAAFALSAWVHRQAISLSLDVSQEVRHLLQENKEAREEIRELLDEKSRLMTERAQALTLIASLTARLDKNRDPEL